MILSVEERDVRLGIIRRINKIKFDGEFFLLTTKIHCDLENSSWQKVFIRKHFEKQ